MLASTCWWWNSALGGTCCNGSDSHWTQVAGCGGQNDNCSPCPNGLGIPNMLGHVLKNWTTMLGVKPLSSQRYPLATIHYLPNVVLRSAFYWAKLRFCHTCGLGFVQNILCGSSFLMFYRHSFLQHPLLFDMPCKSRSGRNGENVFKTSSVCKQLWRCSLWPCLCCSERFVSVPSRAKPLLQLQCMILSTFLWHVVADCFAWRPRRKLKLKAGHSNFGYIWKIQNALPFPQHSSRWGPATFSGAEGTRPPAQQWPGSPKSSWDWNICICAWIRCSETWSLTTWWSVPRSDSVIFGFSKTTFCHHIHSIEWCLLNISCHTCHIFMSLDLFPCWFRRWPRRGQVDGFWVWSLRCGRLQRHLVFRHPRWEPGLRGARGHLTTELRPPCRGSQGFHQSNQMISQMFFWIPKLVSKAAPQSSPEQTRYIHRFETEKHV